MTDPSQASDSDVECDVFLSYANEQKDFAEHLYEALLRRGVNAFFEEARTIDGLRLCRVWVIVLSKEFLSSEQSMMEMERLVLREMEDKKIIPLFFELTVEDLKSIIDKSKKCLRTDALELLRKYNGLTYIKQNGQRWYTEHVASKVCEHLPARTPYNPPLTREDRKLAEAIERHFDLLREDPQNNGKACVIGLLHGGGRIEKRLCQRMVDVHLWKNKYRCCLIALPSNYDELKVVNQWKKALKALRLAGAESSALDGPDWFEQVVHLLKQRIPKFNVFIVIGNVCKGFSEEIEKLWDVRFNPSSRILLSSQSKEVLLDVLPRDRTSYILSLPSSEREDTFEHVQKLEGGEKTEHDWRPMLLAHQVENVIKGLQPIEKHMFLDIAVWIPRPIGESHYTRTYTNALRWLLFFYKDLDKGEITKHIDTLAAAGIVYEGKDENGQQMIGVDDLSWELAQEEANRSPRFLRSTKKAVEEMEWSKLERVILEQPEDHRLIDGVEHGQCRNVQFFYASEIDSRKIPLKSMSRLSALILMKDTGRNKINLNDSHKLEFLWLDGLQRLQGLDALLKLQVLCIWGCSSLKSLDGLIRLARLEALDIHKCHALKEVPNLKELTVLEKLTLRENKALEVVRCLSPALKEVSIEKCRALKEVLNLEDLTVLEKLTLRENTALEVVSSVSPAVKEVSIEKCRALRKTPDLGAVSGLCKLTLLENSSLEEVGCPNASLKELTVVKCEALKRIPDLSGVTGLEKLTLLLNEALEVVGPLGPALKEVKIEGCQALKKMPNLVSATGLEKLLLCENESLEEMGILSSSLKEVTVQACDALKKMPGLEGVSSLEKLTLRDNQSLEELECLGHAVKEVLVEECKSLKKIPDLGGATRLEKLTLCDNESLEEVGNLSPALKVLAVKNCNAMKRLPDLGGVTGLEDLKLVGNESLEEVGSLGPALKRVEVQYCKALERLPDLVRATGLEELRLCYNESLKEVGHLSSALKTVVVRDCGALTQLAGLHGVSGLETLMLLANASLKKAGFVDGAIKKFVSYDCPGFRSDNELRLRGEGWTEEEWKYLERLHRLTIEECATIREMRVGQLTELKRLEVRRCGALEEIDWELGRQLYHMLEEVVLEGCERLKDPRGNISALLTTAHASVNIVECPGLWEYAQDTQREGGPWTCPLAELVAQRV